MYAKGDSYQGSWENNSKSGKYGKYSFADGRVFEGEWKNGKLHGRGYKYASDGYIKEQGIFQDDNLVQHCVGQKLFLEMWLYSHVNYEIA